MSLIRLNSKEKKQFLQLLNEQYGYKETIKQDLLVNKNKGRYYLINPEVLEFSLDQYRIETIGLYFATLMPEGRLRLTIDGAQIIGPHASKNVFDISSEQKKEWIRGHNLEVTTDLSGWLILRCKSEGGVDYLGCGKIVHKDDTTLIHNYIPKARYVRSAIE